MGTLTIRLPDDKHDRLRRLAEQRQISINRLIDELATAALAEHDAYTRFQLRASRGSAEEGLRLLDKLDQTEAESR
jgi:predicted transcriptional regulator